MTKNIRQLLCCYNNNLSEFSFNLTAYDIYLTEFNVGVEILAAAVFSCEFSETLKISSMACKRHTCLNLAKFTDSSFFNIHIKELNVVGKRLDISLKNAK